MSMELARLAPAGTPTGMGRSGWYRLALCAAAVVGLVACLLAWRAEHARTGTWGFPLDDAWIHCQIARNLATGYGWSYNPGVSVQSSSGPLWTALIALGFALFGVTVWVPKILGVAAFLGCVVWTGRLVWVLGGGALTAAGAAFAAALSGPLAWHGLSGMETPLAALLVAMTVDAAYSWTAGRRRLAWGVLAALATAARPETFVLIPLLALDRARSSKRDGLWGAGLAAVFLIPYFALNLLLSGSLFPTTFAAKVGPIGILNAVRHGDAKELLVSMTLGPYDWVVQFAAFWGSVNVGLLLAAPVGVCIAALGPRRTLAPSLLLIALPMIRAMVAPAGNPGLHTGRYVGCLFPLLITYAALGFGTLLTGATALRLRRLRLMAAGIVVATVLFGLRLELRVPQVGSGLFAALPSLIMGGRVSPGIDTHLQMERLGLFLIGSSALLVGFVSRAHRQSVLLSGAALLALTASLQLWRAPGLSRTYSRNVQDINDMDVALGKWVLDHVPAGNLIAICDIGAIAFFGERPIVDLWGLATPEVAPFLTTRHLRTLIPLRTLRPSIGLVFTSWFHEWLDRPSLVAPIARLRLAETTILGGKETLIFAADWDRFSRYYDDQLLERLDPPDTDRSWSGHMDRSMRNLGIPTRAELWARAGDYYTRRADLRNAERSYRTSLQLASISSAWDGLIALLQDQHSNATLGEVLRERARVCPNDPVPHEALGDWLRSAGRIAEAVSEWQAALQLHPDNVRLLRKLHAVAAPSGEVHAAEAYRARIAELSQTP